VTDWAVVTLSTDAAVNMGVVDLRNGRPGVEREVVEEILDGNSAVEGVAVALVIAATE